MFSDFDSNVEELAAMMQRSWAENPQQSLVYSAQHLASALEQPGTSKHLWPAMYDNGKLVAFGAGFPRRALYRGTQLLNLVLNSYVTVASEYKGKGIGGQVWAEIAKRSRQLEYDGLITYCVEGDRMNDILPRCSERAGLTTTRAFSIRYLARPIKASTGANGEADPLVLERNAQHVADSTDLARLWSHEECEWQCRTRDGAFGATLTKEDGAGTISSYAIPSSGEPQTLCGIVDDVLWGDLDDLSKRELVQLFVQAAAAKDVNLVLLPMLEYTDLSPFREAGFRLTRRTLHMYLTVWKPGLQIEPLRSVYMDAF